MPSKLVIVDMQEIFRSPESEWFVPQYSEAAENIRQLTGVFGQGVIWTRFVRDPQEHGSWHEYYVRWSRCRVAPDSDQWQITLPHLPGDSILSLPTFSKWSQELADLTKGHDQLTICGVATDCCVLSTVLGAVDAGKHVTVVTDACAGITAEAHQQALSLMDLLSPMVTLKTTAQQVADSAAETKSRYPDSYAGS